jgi:hypothetical protein
MKILYSQVEYCISAFNTFENGGNHGVNLNGSSFLSIGDSVINLTNRGINVRNYRYQYGKWSAHIYILSPTVVKHDGGTMEGVVQFDGVRYVGVGWGDYHVSQ